MCGGGGGGGGGGALCMSACVLIRRLLCMSRQGEGGRKSFCDRGSLPIRISQMSLLGEPAGGAFRLLMAAAQTSNSVVSNFKQNIYVSLK